jgi:PAS domain S-box-containing protein
MLMSEYNKQKSAIGAFALASLQPLTSALLQAVTPSDVVTAVVDSGVEVLGAEAGLVALVRGSAGDEYLDIVGARGYADEVLRSWQQFPLSASLPLSDAVREQAALFSATRAELEARYPAMFQQGPTHSVKASASLPLVARGRPFGGLHLSFPTEREAFTQEDCAFLEELARQCSLALDRALLLQERENARARQEFLSRASALLAESLNYQTTLDAIACLAVPDLCDWAAVDVVDTQSERGNILHVALAHKDPAEVQWVREAQRRYPVDMTQTGQPEVQAISTGKTVFLPDLPEAVMLAVAQDEEHLRLIRRLDLRSLLCVPLIARGGTLGAVMFATTRASGRSFTPETVELVEDLARRAAIAVDNARLFQSVEVSQVRYRTLFETAALGIVYQDENAAIVDANPAAQRILGLTLEQMQGRTSMDPRWRAVREDGSDYLGEDHPVPRALRSCEVEQGIMGIFHPQDGAYRWIDVTAVPQCRMPGEKAHLVYALFEDITERRRAEEERRVGEERFRALADNIAQLAWMADASGSIFWYNRRWFEYTGTTFEEMQGWGWQTVHHPDYVMVVTSRFKAHVEAGEPWEDTFPLRGVDGSYRWFLSRAFPTRDASGKVVFWCGTNTDITEQRETETRQRRLAREMLYSLTEGKMRLAETRDDLPAPLDSANDEVALAARTLHILRKRVEAVAERFGFVKERKHDLLTAVGEASMNAVKHAKNGVGRVYADPERGIVQVWVTDEGHGIAADQIHRALERGWTTGGFGHGWWFILKAVDRVYLLTGTAGTTVVLEMDRNVAEPDWLVR